MYIARGGNEDKLGAASFQDVIYVNDGKGNFTLDALSLPIFTESNAAVRASDFDHDGDLDLFVGGRNVPFQYPKSTTSRLLKNESVKGHIKFVDVTQTLAKDLINVGLICDGIWSDYDLDGWQDIILAGEFSDIKIDGMGILLNLFIYFALIQYRLYLGSNWLPHHMYNARLFHRLSRLLLSIMDSRGMVSILHLPHLKELLKPKRLIH